MVKIRVISPRPRHILFYMKDLVKTISLYCQYEDNKKIYRMLRCDKPRKPLLLDYVKTVQTYESSILVDSEGKEIETKRILAGFTQTLDTDKIKNADKIRIPYTPNLTLEELHAFLDKLIEFINKLIYYKVIIIWQCPSCRKYTEIKYNSDKILLYRCHFCNESFARLVICSKSKTTPTLNSNISREEFRRTLDRHYLLSEFGYGWSK